MNPQQEISPEHLQIKLAKSETEYEKIFHFRYEVYVEEMGKKVKFDKTKKIITDPLDKTAQLYYIEYENKIITTIRINFLKDGELTPFLSENLSIDKIDSFNNVVSYTSKLLVTPKWRQSIILGKLLNFIYTEGRKFGIQIDLCYCAPSLVAYYELLGYRRYKDNFIDPEVGYRIPMVLIVEDINHLRKAGSPFYRIARKMDNSDSALKKFQEEFTINKYFLTSKLKHSQYFWRNFSNHLHDNQIKLFKSLDRPEAESFISRCTVINCQKGDAVIRTHDVGKEMFVILAGAAEVRKIIDNKEVVLATFGEGQLFGEIAFLSSCERTANVIAISEMKVLVLTQELFKTLFEQIPQTCAKILLNLSVILCERLKSNTKNYLEVLNNQEKDLEENDE